MRRPWLRRMSHVDEEEPMTQTPSEVVALVAEEGFEFVDLRFCDLPGQVQHFTVPGSELTEASFEEGFGFDGSSIRGFKEIQESDMILVPDPVTAVADPFRSRKTLILYCFVFDPVTGDPYTRDPRLIARKRDRRRLLLGTRVRVVHPRIGPFLSDSELRVL